MALYENAPKRFDISSNEIPISLRVVCDELAAACALPHKETQSIKFTPLLQTLNSMERSFVASYFCHLPWNISSVHVLGCLNRLRFLSPTEYILCQTDNEHIILILNDLLEVEFHLIANVVYSAHYDLLIGDKVAEYYNECIRRLYADLSRDPKLNNLDFLNGLRRELPNKVRSKVMDDHTMMLLSMHNNTIKSSFANFSNWMTQSADGNELVSNFYKNAVARDDKEIAKTLLSISSSDHFKGWKNYLLLLGLIIKNSNSECCSFIKHYFKDRLKVAAETKCLETMAHLLLSIRVVLLSKKDNSESYAKWYKQNIADMKFVLNVEDFKAIVAMLTDLVAYETDEEYLEVHMKTTISPPALCSEICRDYKVLCRTRISDIVDGFKNTEVDNEEDLFPDVE